MDDKLPLILFSGGLESSYLLQLQLIIKKQSCDVLTIEHSFNCPSQHAEMMARYKILAEIATLKTTGDLEASVRYHLQDKEAYNSGDYPGYITYSQLYPIVQIAMKKVDLRAHSEVQIGLCMTDDSAVAMPYLKQYWSNFWEGFCSRMPGEYPPLVFPLERTPKLEIFERIDPGLRNNTWYCSSPNVVKRKFVPCRICVSCKDHEFAKTMVEQRGQRTVQLFSSIDQVAQHVESERKLEARRERYREKRRANDVLVEDKPYELIEPRTFFKGEKNDISADKPHEGELDSTSDKPSELGEVSEVRLDESGHARDLAKSKRGSRRNRRPRSDT